MHRTYSELLQFQTLEDRFRYLNLRGQVGAPTFGRDRWINQRFYTSRQWRQIRHLIIARDEGCDLGVPGQEIWGAIHIHHMNPMTVDDIVDGDSWILDPEFLISVSQATHNAIHFGDVGLLPQPYVERRPGDTDLWRRRSS